MRKCLKIIFLVIIMIVVLGIARRSLSLFAMPYDGYLSGFETIIHDAFYGKPQGIQDNSQLQDTQIIR